jgi:two-component system OmpR family sensor kinase
VSLRGRVLVVLLVVTAAVAMSVDAVTYVSLRSFLLRRVDQQLVAAHTNLLRTHRISPDLPLFAPGLYVETRTRDGAIAQKIPLQRPGQETFVPTLPKQLDLPLSEADGGSDDAAAYQTVDGTGDATPYRLATWRVPDGSITLALPLGDVDSTLRRLLVVELAVTAAALAAGILLARSLVQLGLRPLDDIAETAGAIAGGDLTRRVELEDPGTEVGRLGRALNAMLVQIEQAFAERRASEDQLRRFVADASHELRTPLTSIRAYAELFERGAQQRPEDLARLLHGIESETLRMGVLVDDLLLLARLDQGRELEKAPVDLGAIAAEAVAAARAIDPDRPLRLRVAGSVEVAGDRVRVRQIVDNLLANVRAHTPAGTAATVSVQADGATARLIVSDEGPGLPAEQRAKVFERFYRADASRSRDAGGAGLGLAIVAALAAAHGGRVGVRPSPTNGAEFVVELPLYHDAAVPAADAVNS